MHLCYLSTRLVWSTLEILSSKNSDIGHPSFVLGLSRNVWKCLHWPHRMRLEGFLILRNGMGSLDVSSIALVKFNPENILSLASGFEAFCYWLRLIIFVFFRRLCSLDRSYVSRNLVFLCIFKLIDIQVFKINNL